VIKSVTQSLSYSVNMSLNCALSYHVIQMSLLLRQKGN